MKRANPSAAAGAILAMVLGLLTGCESTGGGSSQVSGSVYYGGGFYDPWYYDAGYYPPDVIVTPPPGPPPPRPEHPIAGPPAGSGTGLRPTPMPSIPSAPMPRVGRR